MPAPRIAEREIGGVAGEHSRGRVHRADAPTLALTRQTVQRSPSAHSSVTDSGCTWTCQAARDGAPSACTTAARITPPWVTIRASPSQRALSVEPARDAPAELMQALAAVRARVGVGDPAADLTGSLGVDLGPGATGPVAEVALGEPHVDLRGEPGGGRGLTTAQRRAAEHLAPVRGGGGQRRRRGAAAFVERLIGRERPAVGRGGRRVTRQQQPSHLGWANGRSSTAGIRHLPGIVRPVLEGFAADEFLASGTPSR